MEIARTRALDPSLFSWPSPRPALYGGRSQAGEITFPYREGTGVERIELLRHGTLWSWTVQRFEPKSPPYRKPAGEEEFKPFALGFVELPGQIRVQTRLSNEPPGSLIIGMPMELEIVPLFQDEVGVDVMTYSFRPVRSNP